ncbi:MAG: hypothetical protein JXB88_18065 [Spirochaetales bacterium]|nr:hypothetical protein [Spirochaetales bacterium]
MKKMLSFVLVFSLSGISTGFATMEDAEDNVLIYRYFVIESLKKDGYRIEAPEGKPTVFYLQQDQYIQIEGTFYHNTNYVFLASGDPDAVDIDIEVYDKNWNLVYNGNTDGIDADILLSPNYAIELRILIRLNAVKPGKSGAYVGFYFFYIQ